MSTPIPEKGAGRKPKLLEQARDLLRAKYYRRRTDEAYLGWMRRFILFHDKRHPKEIGVIARIAQMFRTSIFPREIDQTILPS